MTPTTEPQPVDPIDTAALLALAKAATPGPWFRHFSDVVTSNPDPRDAARSWIEEPRAERVVRHAEHLDLRDDRAIADAAFIAAANPETVTRLCEALDQAGAEVERLSHYKGYVCCGECDSITAEAERDAARAEVVCLRAFVEGVRGLRDELRRSVAGGVGRVHYDTANRAAAHITTLLATLDKEETDD